LRSPILVDSTDLELWANRRDAQARLPQLLRRLVRATIDVVEHLAFRAEEGVQLGGWDGVVQAREGGTFVPQGRSVWEAGAGKDPGSKAEDDYRKRSEDPLGLAPAETTFVFVTLRRWSGKDAWAQAKSKEGIWKDVRVFDADDLATWLEEAPAVHLWLSTLLGKKPAGAEDIETFWSNWSGVTRPSITPGLLLAGRQEASTDLAKQLSGRPAAVGLKAETREEAVAFLAATIESLPETARDWHLSRTIVVTDREAWNALAGRGRALILVPMFGDRSTVTSAVSNEHLVVLPVARSEPPLRGTIEVPRLRREEMVVAMKAMGLSEERSRALAPVGRSSLGALRRSLAAHAAGLVPMWAEADRGRGLLAALLAGSWNDANEADRAIISTLSGRPYDEYREMLLRWASEPDAPVRLIGRVWTITAKVDAWTLIAHHLAPVDLERFEAAALEVLREVDPKHDLKPNEQWYAALLGKVRRHSDEVRRGIADTLALMASVNQPFPHIAPATTQQWAERIVRRVFEGATSWQFWASLTDELRVLAEAAPDAFMDAVDRGLGGDDPLLRRTFADVDPLMARSPHVGILWALEVLAWAPEHLGRAARLLAGLAKIDPGGKTANRPAKTLREIFLPWHPSTSATVEQRLRVLNTLRKKEPACAWNLLVSLAPEGMGVASPTAVPRYREWAPEEPRQVSRGDFDRASAEVIKDLREDVGIEGARWKALLGVLGNVPEDEFYAVVAKLLATEALIINEADRVTIRTSLRTLISRNRSFAGAEWSLWEEQLQRLDEVLARFEPADPLERIQHLFGQDHGVVAEDAGNWQARERRLRDVQVAAVGDLYTAQGLASVLKLAQRAQYPGAVGVALGTIPLSDVDESMAFEQTLGSPDASLRLMGRGLIAGLSEARGTGWLKTLRSGPRWPEWTAVQKVDCLLMMPFASDTWDLIDTESPEVQELYWTEVSPLGRGNISSGDRDRAARAFMRFGLPLTALQILSVYSRSDGEKVNPDLAIEVLESTAYGNHRQMNIRRPNVGYEVAELLGAASRAEGVDKARIAMLEWHFLPLLDGFRTPETLEEMLAEAPSLFVTLLEIVYPSDRDDAKDVSEGLEQRAMRGHELLDNWSGIPGLSRDGNLDVQQLITWVSEVRAKAAAVGREDAAESQIARLVARLPDGRDGAWPHEASREIIEASASDELDDAIRIAVYNQRGMVRRSIGEGGAQERVIVARYRRSADLLADQWPRAARLAINIAARYEADARVQDTKAELDEQLRD
jgi:hypothetical protein